MPAGTVVIGDPRTNALFVKGSPEGVQTVRAIVAQIDKPRLAGLTFDADAYQLSNIKASDALAILRTELPAAGSNTFAASDHPNELLLNGTPDFISTAKIMLAAIDKPGKQVRFSIKVLDYTPQNDSSNIGVEFGGDNVVGTPSQGTAQTVWAFANNTVPINAQISLLQSQSRARRFSPSRRSARSTTSKPRSTSVSSIPSCSSTRRRVRTRCSSSTPASISASRRSSAPTARSRLRATPEYSQITSFVQNYPVTSDRHVISTTRIANDKSLVIGGLFQDIDTTTIQKVPLLGDIPILGVFFRNKSVTRSKDEIVFVLTPHVVDATDFTDTRVNVPTLPSNLPDAVAVRSGQRLARSPTSRSLRTDSTRAGDGTRP